jgi:ABC-2 type transport system permease protein
MKILDIAFKDLTQSFRSVFAVGMMVVAPLLLTGLIYFAFGGMARGDGGMTPIQVGVFNADTLPTGTGLEAPLGDSIRSMFFDQSVASWITARDYPEEASIRSAVDAQEIGVAVIIPPDFTERYLSGEQDAQVLIVSDPTLSIGPATVEDMVTMMLNGVAGGGIALQTMVERLEASGITPDPDNISIWMDRYTTWYADFQRDLFHNPDQAALVMSAPAAGEEETVDPFQKTIGLTMVGQMIFFAFFTGAFSMMSILREDEEGTLARLFTTPTDRTGILAGKFLAVFITVILQGVVLLAAGRLAFGVDWGEPGGILLALVGQVIAAVGLGVLLVSFIRNSRQGGAVIGGGLTALGMLGGLFTANIPGAMPEALERLGNYNPQGWVLKTWRMVLDGQPLEALILPLIVLVAMGVIMFAIGAVMFRRRFA